MSTLILLRHGQASFGAARYDALSERGREQAEHLGRHWAERGMRFDRVVVGPRDRHRLTALHALGPLGIQLPETHEPALDEFAEGQQILASVDRRLPLAPNGDRPLSHKEQARRYSAEIDAWAEARVSIEGVPDAAVFRATVAEWLDRITADAQPGQTVLAVTSGGVISAAVALALDLPDARLAHFMRSIYNASLTEFAFSADRPPALVSFNVASYLPESLLTRI